MCLTNVAALSLDLDDTLWAFAPAVRGAEEELYQWLLKQAPATADILIGPETLREYRHRTAIARPDLHDLALQRHESIREVLRSAGEDPDLSDEAYDVFYSARQRVVLFDDVPPALEWLSSRYPIAAITNGNSNLKAIGIEQFFHVTVTAADFGYAKPDPRIFHAAASALGLSPNQILHVGDDLQLDVKGAQSAGLQAAWLVRSEHLPITNSSLPDPGAALLISDLAELCNVLTSDSGRKPTDAPAVLL